MIHLIVESFVERARELHKCIGGDGDHNIYFDILQNMHLQILMEWRGRKLHLKLRTLHLFFYGCEYLQVVSLSSPLSDKALKEAHTTKGLTSN